MSPLGHDTLDGPPEEGARLIALAQLRVADAAAKRLLEGRDEEALHDLRVGVRRLRSTLRSFRPWLRDTLRRRDERRLREHAAGTNEARDAEVGLAWLATQRASLDAERLRPGLELYAARLGERRGGGAADRERLFERHASLSRKLARRLSRYERRIDEGGWRSGPSFAAALSGLLASSLAELQARLHAPSGPEDEAGIHRARIRGKRLRYLLEPLRGTPGVDARDAVKRLKGLQDLLGELHDLHVRGAELAALLEEAPPAPGGRPAPAEGGGAAALAQPRGGLRPGLVALARRARARRGTLFRALQRELSPERFDPFAAEVSRLARALEAGAGGSGAAAPAPQPG